MWQTKPQPLETLYITHHWNGTATTVDRTDQWGNLYPTWVQFKHPEHKALSIVHTSKQCPTYAATDFNQPLGTVKLHSVSSRMDLLLRGVAFEMTRNNFSGTSHKFSFLGTTELIWRQSNMDPRTLYLQDVYGNRLARYKQGPTDDGGDYSGLGGWTGRANQKQRTIGGRFELYVPSANIDMDLLVLTGLAALEYERKNRSSTAEAVGEAVGSVFS